MMTSKELAALIFKMTEAINRFHVAMIKTFELNEHPYNAAGKIFPKKGVVAIGDDKVNYWFHGKGCTLNWNAAEIKYDISMSRSGAIEFSVFSIERFLATDGVELSKEKFSNEEVYRLMEILETEGVFIKREPQDLGSFSVSEDWYKKYGHTS